MISSVKKVISRRIQEIELNRFDSGRVKVGETKTRGTPQERVPIGGEGDDTIYEDEIPF
jgi:hypothetical protein